jgi:glycosyltransferase involved in cell wall biosynthesis
MVSAVMIAKNEDRCMERCMMSILPAVDEIIVVDTGSTDFTIDIVNRLAAQHEQIKLYHFEWIDDFSAARNYALEQATHDWVFVVDADDVLPPEHADRVKELVAEMNKQNKKAVFDVVYDNTVDGVITSSYPKGYIRLFPANLRYKDMIHEQLVFGSMERIQSDIHLLHDGYDRNVVDVHAKKKRNLVLLHQNLQSDKTNAHLWFQLGLEMQGIDNAKALRFLEIAESLTTSTDLISWIQKTRASLAEKS